MIADSNLLNSESRTSLPDVPYEPDLDIEIDFPRGNSSVILINAVTLWAAVVRCVNHTFKGALFDCRSHLTDCEVKLCHIFVSWGTFELVLLSF